jgi:hypothetical protein
VGGVKELQKQRVSGDKVFPLRRHYWPFASSWIYFICERALGKVLYWNNDELRFHEWMLMNF